MSVWGQKGSNIEPSVKWHANLASAFGATGVQNERQQSPEAV